MDDLLFNNKFVKNTNIKDTPSDKKEQFKRYYEQQMIFQKRKQILDKHQKPKSNFVNHESQKNIKIEKKTVISIDSRNRDFNRYPNQNDFIIFLGKTFLNVKKIELVSSEFPNTDQVIKSSPPQLQNNLVSWENSEDINLNFFHDLVMNNGPSDVIHVTINHKLTVGSKVLGRVFNSKLDSDTVFTGILDAKRQFDVLDSNTLSFPYIGGIPGQGTMSLDLEYPSYDVEIKPGNYTASTLSQQMQKDLGLVKRTTGTGAFHYFEVKVNLDTDVLYLDSVVTTQLPINSLSTIAGSTTITVNQAGHGFKTGDRVKMIGVKNTAGINASMLNGDFEATVLDFNTFTYEIITRASETTDGGGNTISTGRDAPFRLLFDTKNTRIQFNTGFPNENSSEDIRAVNPITTKALKISNVIIISPTRVRFTTLEPHGLQAVTVVEIVSIQQGNNPIMTTSVPHGITFPTRVSLRNTNSFPQLNGSYFAIPLGESEFTLQGVFIITPGNAGELVYGNDKIKIYNLKAIPSILIDPDYFVENIPSPNQFDIVFRATSIDTRSIPDTVIGTNHIIVEHPSHGFNQLSSITSLSNNTVNVKTFLPHTLTGSRTENVEIIEGPTNTVDVILPSHGLFTSDLIKIRDSSSTPVVDGDFRVQVVDVDTLRINFVFSTFTSGFGTVLTGDVVTLSNTSCLPRIDGTYSVHNRLLITSISVDTIASTISTSVPHNWSVGDIITVSNSDSIPSIDGEHTIYSVVNSTSFQIDLEEEITTPGTSGVVVNNNRFEIRTDFEITTPGANPAGVIGRDNNVVHYRIQGDTEGSSSIAGIPLSVLNGTLRNIDTLIDRDTYMVRVIEEYSNQTIKAGGRNVKVSSHRHGFRSIQANTRTGKVDGVLHRSISLEGENYVYLVSESDGIELNTVLNSSSISNTFAKIILNESPGTLMFNSFISEPKIFDNPIARIDTMRFKVVTPGGFPFDFNDIDYSFTLRVTELVDQMQSAFISSRTGTNEFENMIRGQDYSEKQKNDIAKSVSRSDEISRVVRG